MKRTPLKRNTALKPNRCKLKRTPFKQKPVTKVKKKSPDLVEQLDKVFSKFIRLRDAGENGYTVCISCGKKLPFELMQCGHFFPRWHMNTRWDEDNCHSQCVFCNCHNHGNLEAYKENLIKKIGQSAYARLEIAHNEIRKWSNNELKDLIKYYKKEIKRFS